MRTATPATDDAWELAEGPLWDAARGVLRWVDINAGRVLEGRFDGERITVLREHRFEGTVGAVAAAEDGRLLVAGQERLLVVAADGTVSDGPRIVTEPGSRRTNDGTTDPAGRFLVGTKFMGAPDDRDVLVRVEADGVRTLDDDLRLSNGLAFAADGTRLYSIDTLRHTVFVRAYDPATGAIGERRVHLEVADGFPDGCATDVEDHLWVAVWGAGEVRRYAPDGALVDRVVTGAPHTSSCCFAGEDLRTLVITTAQEDLDDRALAAAPDSGRLFTVRVDVPGVPVAPWDGRLGPT